MSFKLKALGVALLAAMSVSAVAVMNASAATQGHFESDIDHTLIVGFEGGTHNLHLTNHGLSGEVGCTEDNYHATTTSKTVTSITVTASYSGCTTTGTQTSVPVDMNGCHYTFTVTSPVETTHSPVHVICPAGQAIKVTHPNCTVTVHPQTVESAVKYTTTKPVLHEITLDVTAQFTTTRHGLCQFIAPTNGTGTLGGSATVKGFDTEEKQVNITAT